ncbi:sensor domain-containing diguanylate cyclase [Oribacterium sp. P6A1]|uniref:sensor domain-containing diguanylate cyclase n=1 Tax=Oribacterium sp. P6A1 TaxID=1410612 RepID=UPI00056D7748|nr:GGDEF domain-containing protein [Oribacterium sp. P6A1]
MGNQNIESDESLIKNAFLLFDKMSELHKNLPVAYAVFQAIPNEEGNGASNAKYLYANGRFCSGLGRSKDEIVGGLVTETFQEDISELLEFGYRAAFLGEESHHTTYSKFLGHWMEFTIAATNIEGCFIVVCTFIDDSHLEKELLRRNSTTDDAIVRITRLLSSEGEYENIMNSVLEEIGHVIHPSRMDILITDRITFDSKFRWCADENDRRKDILSGLSYEQYLSNWRKYLNEDQVIRIDDVEILKENEPEGYRLLKELEIERFIWAPFFDNKHRLLGFLCADNYELSEAIDTMRLIQSISYFIGFRIRNQTLVEFLDYRGNHDELTGLKNRRVFGEKLKILSHIKEYYGLFYVDLNLFKHANDNYGHQVGNDVLKETALRLSEASDFEVYRLGGDEFAILVDKEIPESEYEQILLNIDEAFSKPILETDEYSIRISASAGYAMAPYDSDNPNELRKIADQRMYKRKKVMHEEIGSI